MMELYIARHGETEYNLQRRWQGGGYDSPLTPKGIAQARGLREILRDVKFDAIYSSPLGRAMNTACIVFDDERLFECRGKTDLRLKEVMVGEAEGMPYDDIADIFPSVYPALMHDPPAYIPPPGGENLTDMIVRVDSFLQELAKKPYERAYVQAHGYVLRVVYACSQDKSVAAIGSAPIFDNCALARYTYSGNRWEYLADD